jgi:Protein of unknown function (DUF2846)
MTTGKWLPLLVIVTLVGGCMTAPGIPMASPASDADAKQFLPPAGKANLYVSRSNGSSGASFDVSVDEKLLGPIGPGTFYLFAVDPGRHEVSVKSMMTSANITMDAAAGKNYFYEVTATSSGYAGKPSLGMVLIEEMGKLMVRQAQRAQSSGE